jgi:hypothetical protein
MIRVIKSRRMRGAGHVAYSDFFVRPEGWRWEDNIKMEAMGCENLDWIHLANDRDSYLAKRIKNVFSVEI